MLWHVYTDMSGTEQNCGSQILLSTLQNWTPVLHRRFSLKISTQMMEKLFSTRERAVKRSNSRGTATLTVPFGEDKVF